MKTLSFLWPDHVIGKRESRRIREEHNKLVNNHAELLEAVTGLLETLEWLGNSGNLKSPIEPHPFGLGVIMAKQNARSAITKAKDL